MDDIKALLDIDLFALIVSIFVILYAVKSAWSLIEWCIGKLGLETKSMRKKREQAELLTKTVEAVAQLQIKHNEDMEKECTQDAELRAEFDSFMLKMEQKFNLIDRQQEERRNQSFQIQDKLTGTQDKLADAIKNITEVQSGLNLQIEALMCGNKEVLGDIIDQRFDRYIKMGGIPQNEIDEFDSIFEAYAGLNGNHGRELKYKYVKEHLKVFPVETKIMTEFLD